jgi:hypothetical protein
VAYWAAAARATVINVSPVESETRWRWKKLAVLDGIAVGCGNLWIAVEKGTLRQGVQAGPPRRRNQRTNSQARDHLAHECCVPHKSVDKFHVQLPSLPKILNGQTNPIQ